MAQKRADMITETRGKLIKAARLSGVSSAFSMEQIKYTTALPLELVSHGLPS